MGLGNAYGKKNFKLFIDILFFPIIRHNRPRLIGGIIDTSDKFDLLKKEKKS